MGSDGEQALWPISNSSARTLPMTPPRQLGKGLKMSTVTLFVLATLAQTDAKCYCVPFTQCGEDGYLLEYGDLITIDIRWSVTECEVGEVCCKTKDELDTSVLGHASAEVKIPLDGAPAQFPGQKPGPQPGALPSRPIPLPVTSQGSQNQPQPPSDEFLPGDVQVLMPTLPKGLRGCGLKRGNPLDVRLSPPSIGFREPTFFGEYPWVVALWKESTGEFLCGGSLITPGVVLTAAHCLFKNGSQLVPDLLVVAGDWDTTRRVEPLPHQIRRGVQLRPHPEFNYRNLINDVGLVFLDKPVEITAAVDTVCITEKALRLDNCQASGWGLNLYTKKPGARAALMSRVSLPLVERGECLARLRNTRLGQHFKLHQGFVCAGGIKHTDTCKGDGGGPLICQNREDPEGRFVQVGIVSWGIDCGTDVPAVYTSVSYYYPWIAEQIASTAGR